MQLSRKLGFWSSLLITPVGGVYFCVMAAVAMTGGLSLPPSAPLQLFGGATTLILAPLLLVLAVCLKECSPTPVKVLGAVGVAFTVLFVAMVSINRFVQLTVVQQSVISNRTEGLDRFMPYDPGSVMFALEILGWGLFLGLAMAAFASQFGADRLERNIRRLLLGYAVLGITSAAGYMAASPLAAVGFIAWGLVLYVATALLTIWFRRSAESLSN
jgi:hypothetical protein